MNLLNYLHQQLEENALQNKAFLIGFSGGVDSTALLHLFAQLQKIHQFKLRAVHIHHGLSPNADDWLAHCQKFCQQLALPLIVEKVQLKGQSNIEAEARQARYQAIKQCLAEDEVLVTAHHLDDQCETFLLALKRGSGVKGLAAMSEQSELFSVPIFRPLLSITKVQLEQYVMQHHLPVIFDESNDDIRYERNFLRKEVLPLLQQRWHNIGQAIARTARLCAEQQDLLQELLQPIFAQHLTQDGAFQLAQFATYSKAKQKQLLRIWLAYWHQPMPSQRQMTTLLEEVIAAQKDRQPELHLNHRVIRRYLDKLYLTPNYRILTQTQLPINIGETVVLPDDLGLVQCQQHAQYLFFDWQQKQLQIECYLNNPQISIRFHYSRQVKISPQAKRTDIKKVWQKLHVPPWQRNRIPLIFINDKFYGAIGYFNNYAE